MKRILALTLLLAAPATSATLPNPNWPAPADRSDLALRNTVLRLHNQARREFGVVPLAWNDELAAGALQHARTMASTGIYGHDRTPGRRKTAGENLWRGPRGVFAYEVMLRVMVDERRLFRPGAFPDNSATGDWQAVAHYTQIVWPTTTEVGCALASSATTDYFVCRYAPTGNKDGYYLAANSGSRSNPIPGGGPQVASRRD